MLTTFLAAAALSVVLQTGDAGDAAGIADREVTSNDPKAVAFVDESEALVHHPEENGLDSLSFEYDMNDPSVGRLGTVKVSWRKGADGDVVAEPNLEALPSLAMMGTTEELLSAQLSASGLAMLALQRGLMKAQILEQAFVKMDGVEDGMVQMRCYPRDGSDMYGVVNDMVVLFDPDGLMKEMRMAMSQQGMSIKRVEKLDWKDAGDGSYVLNTRVAETELPNPLGGGTMKITETTTHQHLAVGALTLVKSFTTKVDAPMPGTGGEQTTSFTNITVNGEAVGG